MSNDSRNAPTWYDLDSAARQALLNKGYTVSRASGHGGSNVWMAAKDGHASRISVRTTRDRWFAFVPVGEGWKTLDDVDEVVVASVDRAGSPSSIQVYKFPADEVRRRFDAALAARRAAGHKVNETRGIWLSLDPRQGDSPSNVGSGFTELPGAFVDTIPLATAPYVAMARSPEPSASSAPSGASAPVTPSATPRTIPEVVADARRQIAAIAGVEVDAVRIDLKIGY